MSEEDPIDLWHLAADLSIVDAAILIAGGDPSAQDSSHKDAFDDPKHVKRTIGHPGFTAAFTGIKAAVMKGHIPTVYKFRARSTSDASEYYYLGVFHLVSKEKFLHFFKLEHDPFDETDDTIVIDEEPDWSATYVNVDDLITWLRGRGYTKGFFFSSDRPDPDEFMDTSHEHFAPELALAVSVWRALAKRQKFPKGPKPAVDQWIKENPDAWKGDEPVSAEAIERIKILVNWKRGGGANPTGG